MDEKNTFLQGELDEEVYMVQPPDFKSSKSGSSQLTKEADVWP